MRFFTALALSALLAGSPSALAAQEEPDSEVMSSDGQSDQDEQGPADQNAGSQDEQQASGQALQQSDEGQAAPSGEAPETEEQPGAEFDSVQRSRGVQYGNVQDLSMRCQLVIRHGVMAYDRDRTHPSLANYWQTPAGRAPLDQDALRAIAAWLIDDRGQLPRYFRELYACLGQLGPR